MIAICGAGEPVEICDPEDVSGCRGIMVDRRSRAGGSLLPVRAVLVAGSHIGARRVVHDVRIDRGFQI